MRINLSHKLFAGFACLSLLTLILGYTTFTFVKKSSAFQERINQLQDFNFAVKGLDEATGMTAGGATHPAISRADFVSKLARAEKLAQEILQSNNCPPGLCKPGNEKECQAAINEIIVFYRQAAMTFFDDRELTEKIRKKARRIYLEMMKSAEKIPLDRTRAMAINTIHLLEILKHEFEETSDPELIGKIKKAIQPLQNPEINGDLAKNAEDFFRLNEQVYFTSLAIINARENLSASTARFLEIAAATSAQIISKNRLEQRRLQTITVALGCCSVVMTLLFWFLTTRRLSGFLVSQKKAITAIRSGDYDYEMDRANGDELSEICLFTKDLALNLREEIQDRERFQLEKKELEYQFLQAQKLESIGMLAGGVAHDFNNLLTGIIGYSDLALAQLEDSHPVKRYLQIIADSGRKAGELTRQLLAFSRKQELRKVLVNPNLLITNLGKMLNRIIGEDIVLELIADPDLPNVMADPAQIEQTLMNMAVNARDAMPDGGKLTIRTSAATLGKSAVSHLEKVDPGDFVRISITDTGTGISAAIKEKIFDPFFTTKEADRGTGLGLATVFGIIRQHNGFVTVDSEPGSGTTFNIFLPVIKTDTTFAAPESAADEASRHGHETILLVDDNDTVRDFACETLEHYGYKIQTAATGAAAIRIINQTDYRIDLLLTDVVMPGMNGRELVEKVRKTNEDLKVIYMSGYTDKVFDQEIIREEENHGFLRKPLTVDALTRKVRQILDH